MLTLTHEQYTKDIDKLYNELRLVMPPNIQKVFGIPRGGMYPAAMLAQKLRFPLVFNPNEIDGDTVVVDDLVDSGETMRRFMSDGKGGFFAAVYLKGEVKDGRIVVGCAIPSGEWIVFPDETGGGIEENFRRTLEYIGEDTRREGLVETPKRMRRAYDEIFAGYKTDPKELVKTFVQGSCKEMVILKRCEFYSTCEHHFFPFFGHCSIGYLPNDKVIGVSKLARLLDCFSKRMQIQERMTAQIADFLMDELGAKGVYVVCEGVHFCMTSRGIRKQDASMVTSAIRGVFEENAQARAEFLQLIRL